MKEYRISDSTILYINHKIVQYILNRTFPEDKKFKNFYYDNLFYLNTKKTKNLVIE